MESTTHIEQNSSAKPKTPAWATILIALLFILAIGLIIAIAVILVQTATTTTSSSTQTTQSIPPTQTLPPLPADPVANWKTYTNEELGISFKHPADWAVKFVAPAEGAGYAGASTADLQIGEIVHIMRSQAKEQITKLSIGNQVKNPSEMPPITINGSIYKFTKVVSGEGHSVTATCGEGGSQTIYYFEINQELVAIYSNQTFTCDTKGEQIITKTKAEDLEIARLVAGTISFSE